MHNPEKLVTLGTQDTRQTKQKTQHGKPKPRATLQPHKKKGSKQDKWLVAEEIKIRNANVMMCSSLLEKEDKLHCI